MLRQLAIALVVFGAVAAADVLTVVAQGSVNPDFYIPYTLGAFSTVPYGEYISGTLVVVSNNLCDSTALPAIGVASPFVLMAKRGDCEFIKKGSAAESLGAKLLIIYDNQTATQPPIMRISNTMPNLITMPAVSITMAAGQKLKDLIAVTPVVSIEIYFAVNKTARPQIRLLMYQGAYTYKFVDQLSTAFSGTMKDSFDLAALIYRIPEGCNGPACVAADCLLSGQWCMPPIQIQPFTGKQYIEESLRQYNILTKSQAAWWSYMSLFKQNCFDATVSTGCVPAAMMAAAGLIQSDIDSVEAQVTAQIANPNAQTSRLSIWRDTLRNESVMDFYGIKVNGIHYIGVGTIDSDSLVRFVCASYTTAPAQCAGKLPTTTNLRTVNSTDITLKAIGVLNLNLTTEFIRST